MSKQSYHVKCILLNIQKAKSVLYMFYNAIQNSIQKLKIVSFTFKYQFKCFVTCSWLSPSTFGWNFILFLISIGENIFTIIKFYCWSALTIFTFSHLIYFIFIFSIKENFIWCLKEKLYVFPTSFTRTYYILLHNTYDRFI